ncbi:LysR family transcriptional regulator [Lysinibacillus yapensis]|uniref:LysR family transcriptional regulator n=1 Tax=Ureibacillus yapensis TaxID=2304605 RepID=A0A396SBF1_9BACL|nr:LysR family transcriptional regulator [Lysinibacillus yapensis]RHW38360.1 LysR family transcriptional regulator [Lysinibacillus yapensis]
MKEDLSLEYLQAIQQYGNFSHAAKALFVSQPYLSKYIKILETKLGVNLVNRQITPLTLTYAGELYVSYMKDIQKSYAKMQVELEAISNLKKGRLIVGMNPILASYTLFRFLPQFMKKYPGIEIELEEGTASEMESLILQNKVDICLNMLPISNPELVYEELFEENIYLVIPSEHPLYDKNNVTPTHVPFNPKSLKNEKFILLKPGLGLRRLTDGIFEHYEIKQPNIILETNNIENAFRLCINGNALTFIPESVVTRDQVKFNANLYTLGNPIFKNYVVINYKKDALLSPAAKAFLQFTKEKFIQF